MNSAVAGVPPCIQCGGVMIVSIEAQVWRGCSKAYEQDKLLLHYAAKFQFPSFLIHTPKIPHNIHAWLGVYPTGVLTCLSSSWSVGLVRVSGNLLHACLMGQSLMRNNWPPSQVSELNEGRKQHILTKVVGAPQEDLHGSCASCHCRLIWHVMHVQPINAL